VSPEQENALRATARKCWSEIINTIDGKPKSEHDRIITSLLDKHAKIIAALPPNTFPAKLWLSYYVRQVDKEQKSFRMKTCVSLRSSSVETCRRNYG